MKEYYAINILEGIYEDCVKDSDKEYMEKNLALTEAVKALSEIQQYRAIGTPEELKQLKENGAFTGMELAQIAVMQMELKKYMAIGTVEECRKAMEKQRKKKLIGRNKEKKIYMCQCGNTLINTMDNFCGSCGQAIDWSGAE